MSNIDQLEFRGFAGLSGVSDTELVTYLNGMYKQGSYHTVESLQYKIGGLIAWAWREKPTTHPLYKNYVEGHTNQDSGVRAAKADVARLWEAIKNPAALQKNSSSMQTTSAKINSAPVTTTSTSVPTVASSTAVATSGEEGIKKYLTTKNMLIAGGATAAILYFVLK